MASAELPNVDLSSVDVDGNRLLLAGAADVDAMEGLSSPAWFAYLPIQGGIPSRSYNFTGLPGYVGTDVAYNTNSYYAVSGDNGAVARLDKNTGAIQISVDVADLRAVRTTGSRVVVLSGSEGLKIYNESLSLTSSISTTVDVPASKRTIDFYNDYVLAAEGANGVGIYNINNGTLFSRLSIPDPEGQVDPSDVVTNAVSVNGNNIFTANGGGGIAIYKTEGNGEPQLLGKTQFTEIEQSSSNFIISRENYVFVASGRGGLKILKLTDLTPPATACNGTYGPYLGETQWDYNINPGQIFGFADSKEFSSGINIGGTLNWCGVLKVNGHTNVNSGGTLNVFGTLLVAQNFSVNANMTLNGIATVGRDLNVNSGAVLSVKGNLTQGNAGVTTTLQVNGRLLIDGEVICYGNLNINGGGRVEFANSSSKLIVYGNVANNGTVTGGSITKISS